MHAELEPLLLSLLSFGVLTFRHQILRHVDRLFRREAADHTEALARLERGLRSARTIRDISGVLKREIDRAVRPRSVAVLLVDEWKGQLVSLESGEEIHVLRREMLLDGAGQICVGRSRIERPAEVIAFTRDRRSMYRV